MKVFTIIVTFNGINWIEKCIQSLINSSIKTNIVVIDNGSNDGTQNLIKTFKEIQFIQAEENLGFGKANNLGIKLALEQGADYLFLLNQDAWVEHNTIENLIKIDKPNKDIGIISPLHLNGEGNAIDKLFSYCIAPSINNQSNFYFSDLVTNQVKEVYSVNFINAAAWLIPKHTIEKIGLFDELFFHYGEDENYCQRANYHDLKIIFVPESKIYHDRGNRNLKIQNDNEWLKRKLMIELANVNNSKTYIDKRFKYLKRHYLINYVKNLVSLKYVKNNLEIYRFLKKSKKEILKSWTKNKK